MIGKHQGWWLLLPHAGKHRPDQGAARRRRREPFDVTISLHAVVLLPGGQVAPAAARLVTATD
jgi:hypothetical protein